MCFRRAIAVLLAAFMLFGGSVAADTPSEQTVGGNISAEYISEDMYEEYSVSAAAIPVTNPPEIKAAAIMLMEISTGRVLHEQNSKQRLSPASITKIMTLLLVMEAIERGELTLSDKVTVSEHAASMGGSQIWLEVGETMSVDNLLKAVAVGSANDASVALAEHIAGSEDGFVALMNVRAAELKMTDTQFKNACGLDGEGHYSSARDIAIMSAQLLHHELVKKYTTIWMDSLRGGETQLVNTNKLVRYYMGATGLKTGTTDKAGFCLAASARRNAMELVAVVLNAESSNERFAGAKKLLDYGFANYCMYTPGFDESAIGDIAVAMGQQKTVPAQITQITPILIKNSDKNKITTKLTMEQTLEAPVEKGQQAGRLSVLNDGKDIASYDILTTQRVARIDFGYMLKTLFNAIICR